MENFLYQLWSKNQLYTDGIEGIIQIFSNSGKFWVKYGIMFTSKNKTANNYKYTYDHEVNKQWIF